MYLRVTFLGIFRSPRTSSSHLPGVSSGHLPGDLPVTFYGIIWSPSWHLPVTFLENLRVTLLGIFQSPSKASSDQLPVLPFPSSSVARNGMVSSRIPCVTLHFRGRLATFATPCILKLSVTQRGMADLLIFQFLLSILIYLCAFCWH